MWAERLFGCLEHLNVGERLVRWAEEAEAAGRSDEADAHRQVWRDFVELLDEFVRALGDEPLRVQEFRETIEAGLAEFNLGLAPPTLDQVLVGGIERSRHPAVRAVLLLGFDESHFPMRRSEDPLLGDREREALEERGVELGRSRRRQLLDERMLAYIALTRASERLWISYPRSDADGKPLQPSPYLDAVVAAVPGRQVRRLDDGRTQRQPPQLTRVAELGGWLAREFRRRPLLEEEPERAARSIWNGLYIAARSREEWRHTVSRTLAGLGYTNVAALEAGTMARALASPFVASVSRLERFAACPFSHFLEYTLGLKERVEADLAHVDLGTLCHNVLENLVGELSRQEQRLADLDDDEITQRIDAIAADIVPRIANDMMLSDARNAYLFDRSRRHLHRVTRWQRDAARVGRFRPVAVEYPFGYADSGYAPLTLTTPGGRTVLLRGKIDRVDVADLGDELVGAVIDYKRTTDRRLEMVKVYHGLTLQLVGYLLALEQTGQSLTGRPIRPVAAFYLPLLRAFETVAHPDRERKGDYRWRGIADVSALEALDATAGPGQRSQYLAAAVTRDGRPHTISDLARRGQMARLMAHVGRRMGELADRLLDGDVRIDPYRLNLHMPCSYCTYKPVCRYEIMTQPPRTLPSMRKQEVLELLGGDADE